MHVVSSSYMKYLRGLRFLLHRLRRKHLKAQIVFFSPLVTADLIKGVFLLFRLHSIVVRACYQEIFLVHADLQVTCFSQTQRPRFAFQT